MSTWRNQIASPWIASTCRSTASRTAVETVASSNPTTAASGSWAIGAPATATARATSRAGSEARQKRVSMMSRSGPSSAPSARAAPAAHSSSTMSGLPPERSKIFAIEIASTSPTSVSTRRATSAALRGGTGNGCRELRARDLGQELAHRMLTGQFVVATGHHQPDRPVDHVPGQNRQDLARPAVGPVHVLDDDEQRIRCARRVAQREQFLEHLLGRQPGDARRRYAVAVTPGGPHQLDERRVPQRFATDRDASAREHGRSRPRRVGQQRLDQS